jgi:hypothetical protein
MINNPTCDDIPKSITTMRMSVCRKTEMSIKMEMDAPFWGTIEQSRRGMDKHRCSFNQCLVALLGILLGRMSEVAGADCTTNSIVIGPT